jgi:hypothetical protein
MYAIPTKEAKAITRRKEETIEDLKIYVNPLAGRK